MTIRTTASRLVLAGALMAAGGQAAQAAPEVSVSITPLHSLVAGVMDGVGAPSLLVEGGQSPHTYSLTPSEAARLENADLVVWVGPGLESFLESPLRALTQEDRVLRVMQLDDLRVLDARLGGGWEAHDHGNDHGHDHGHDDDAHDDDHGHDDHAHDGDHDHHIWLDPHNAEAVVRAVAARLSEIDPDNAETYAANAAATLARIEEADRKAATMLEPVVERPYIVFHDAYQYFERHYGLNAVGSITVSPDRQPGAQRLNEIRSRIVDDGAVCVFREPQFEPRLVETVTEGTPARSGVLDPLGAGLEPGLDAYPQILHNLAVSLNDCLGEAS